MDLEQELGKALADPEIMNKVGSLLSQLSGGNSGSEGDSGTNNDKMQLSGVENNVLSALSGTVNDDRTKLLMAIKPFLSEKRAPYMDSALTILKLVKMGKLGKDLKLF